MNIKLLTLGKPQPALYKSTKEYLDRITHFCNIEHIVLKSSELDGIAGLAQEFEAISRKINEKAFVALLTRTGKELASAELATLIEKRMLDTQEFMFIIGGANGVYSELHRRANLELSFSKMTFQHDIALLVLAEQIYRAFSIIKNLPYHRG
jgi:23S rRNA (pseudouridine1915-N3)-methyltransferase